MTASEFEEHWKAEKATKKVDFIHMIQVGVDEHTLCFFTQLGYIHFWQMAAINPIRTTAWHSVIIRHSVNAVSSSLSVVKSTDAILREGSRSNCQILRESSW